MCRHQTQSRDQWDEHLGAVSQSVYIRPRFRKVAGFPAFLPMHLSGQMQPFTYGHVNPVT
jgi:hypothetical protein